MTKLNEMWDALAAYQPQADAAGHGKSWKKMCRDRTPTAASAASVAAYVAVAAYADAAAAADAAAKAENHAQKAIDKIKRITVAQRTWVDLTEEERFEIRMHSVQNMGKNFQETLCKAIEAKLKQKNGYAEEMNI